jgi:hypothetical protein
MDVLCCTTTARKPRITFTAGQKAVLEAAFAKNVFVTPKAASEIGIVIQAPPESVEVETITP